MTGLRLYLAGVVVVAALVGYGIFLYVLWDKVGETNATTWERRFLLFSGVEAVVFAGVGWLFGKEVNRGAADAAHDANAAARDQAKQAGEMRGQGQALADAIRSTAQMDARATLVPEAKGQEDQLVELANKLFPARP